LTSLWAYVWFEWHPFHSLMTWDAPVNDLVSAGRHARAADRP
jgi:hypothetical protein